MPNPYSKLNLLPWKPLSLRYGFLQRWYWLSVSFLCLSSYSSSRGLLKSLLTVVRALTNWVVGYFHMNCEKACTSLPVMWENCRGPGSTQVELISTHVTENSYWELRLEANSNTSWNFWKRSSIPQKNTWHQLGKVSSKRAISEGFQCIDLWLRLKLQGR